MFHWPVDENGDSDDDDEDEAHHYRDHLMQGDRSWNKDDSMSDMSKNIHT